MPMSAMEIHLLEMLDISKSFPGVQALDKVSFSLRPGEIHALVGENGAGKSTLIKVLSGVYSLDHGTIKIEGNSVEIASPAHAQALGIGAVQQELSLVPYLSVAENIFLGNQPKNRYGLIDHRQMKGDAANLLEELGVSIDPSMQVGTLSIADRQMVAIARVVALDTRIVIFDEPTSSLTDRETEFLFSAIRRLREHGRAVIYISHRMEEIFELCDTVTVLRDGHWVGTAPVAEMDIAGLISRMIGRTVSDLFRKEEAEIGETVLEVRNLHVQGLLEGVSFNVRRGEIVGLAGLVGAGRTELARAIFGDLRINEGEITVDGAVVRNRSPKDAIRAGIGLIPEDRKEAGLILEFSVARNISAAVLSRISRFGFIPFGRERNLAKGYVDKLGIQTPSVEQKVMYLSGGNQQRVVLAKWLAMNSKLLIVDEPTRGIDVGGKADIHSLLCALAKQGAGILMISSELPEVLAMSDRILVMRGGQIRGELPRDKASEEGIMRLAVGQQQVV